MGRQLKLVRLNDFIADVDYIDLLADGFDLAIDGYLPTVAPIGARSVNEPITLKLQGTSKDDLAAMTQEIDEKIKQVQWWIEAPGVERYQVWLRVQLDNETYPRQAQILNIRPPEKLRVYNPPEINANWIGEYQIGIERTPFWEDPYPYPTTTDKTGLCPLGGTVALSETINGDVPARLAQFSINESARTFGATDMWIGWRTSRFGTVANFVPVWSLDLGSSLIGDTIDYPDANSKIGFIFKCDFSIDATMVDRCWVRASDVAGSDANDQRGSYTVLLRAKMSDSSVARVRLGFGFVTGANASGSVTYRSRQIITNGGGSAIYRLYEMGSVSIPNIRTPLSTSLSNFSFIIGAERISGAGDLMLDALILIPNAEGYIKVGSSGEASGTSLAQVYQTSQNEVQSFLFSSSVITRLEEINPINWSLPANGEAPNIFIAANNRNYTGSPSPGMPDYTDANMNITYTYIPRWRTLRGSVT